MPARTSAEAAQALASLRAQYRQLLERLESNAHHFLRLARSVYRVQEDEKRRLARDLHDGIGQNLTALKHQLGVVIADSSTLNSHDRERIERAIGLCATTLDDTRQLSRLLRPQVLDDLGLEPALRWLTRTLGESSEIPIEVQIEPLPALPAELESVLFRIAQEALGNVLRHASANQALVRLAPRDGWLRLVVWDDGIGFDVTAADARSSSGVSSGLSGMRERARLFGGRVAIESRPGDTRIIAQIPIPQPAPPIRGVPEPVERIEP